MATPTQTDADKGGISLIGVKTTEGVIMLPFGSIYIGMGTGSPNGEVTAPKGSLFIDVDAPDLYMNTDASTTWELVGGQT